MCLWTTVFLYLHMQTGNEAYGFHLLHIMVVA